MKTYPVPNYFECIGFDNRHPAIQRAKEFVFKYQSREGDIRGIYWDQYSPNYSAGFFELLIKAGYTNDRWVLKGLEWLLSMRQYDGGWAISFRTAKENISIGMDYCPPIQPDKSKRFSYMVTGVVIRAFAYHPEYKREMRLETLQKWSLRGFLKEIITLIEAPSSFGPSFSSRSGIQT